MKQLLTIGLFIISGVLFSQNETLFKRGNDLYNDGKYAEAIDIYSKIIESGKHSAEVYFNLGNAHYKLNNIAPSIYNYEKALLLSPNDNEIKNNIAFARNMTIDAIDVVPEVGFSKILKTIINTFSFDNWAKLSIALVIAFVLLFLLYYFSYSTTRKRLAFVGSFLVLFLGLLSLAFAFKKFQQVENDNPAIVFAQESRVKSDPNNSSAEAFRLHEGTKVQILEDFDNWKKIRLSDGKTGWIANEDIKELKF